jgi:collagenase-like PrtC family protease
MKPELLLPAGNWDCLKAAVENGADAVYFGVGMFNARRRAKNFDFSDLKKVVPYCHEHGVKVYCTMNILVKNSEVQDFFNYVKKLYLSNVDAVIIQEISFLPIIKQNFPDLEVHVSTQAAITNSYMSQLVKDADKVVLPREFSKKEIRDFIEKTSLPTEIFVQGALCFSYSGKCLFSSMIGGRSGNRGLCAQPCRRRYNGSYLLSMKDLCLVETIPELIDLGVSSLKIEGRLRSPQYVAAATKLYRKAIDSYYSGKFEVDRELFKEMQLAFNREFTEGYFSGDKELISPEKPMGRGIYLGTIGEDNLIKLEEDLAVGDGLGIWLKDRVDGAVLKKMEKESQSIENAKAGDVVKLFIRASPGTKIYKTSTVKEVKKINFERKDPIKNVERKDIEIKLPELVGNKSTGAELLVKVYSLQDSNLALSAGADKVFYNIFAEDFDSTVCSAYVPRILDAADVKKVIGLVKKYDIKDILIGDLGVYAKLREKNDKNSGEISSELNIYLDYSSNVFNDIDMNFFSDTLPVISPELSYDELCKFKNKNFAVLAHGDVVLMNTKYLKLPGSLKDEKKYCFKTRKEHDYLQILNSKRLGLFGKVCALKDNKINKFFLDLNSDVEKIVKTYSEIIKGVGVKVNKKDYTKGHWSRGVE